jgi:structural maintenance of chromosome 3 (chondroitin sulfate proteoglycan 6)
VVLTAPRFEEANSRLQALYAKQGRLAQFSSRPERDAFLCREIDSLGKFRENQSSTVDNLQLELDQTTSRQKALLHREEELETKLHERKERLSQLDKEISSFKQQHTDLSEQRKLALLQILFGLF